jgi:hypothetical protein
VTFPFSQSLRWKTSESHLTSPFLERLTCSHPLCPVRSNSKVSFPSVLSATFSGSRLYFFLHGTGNLIAICLLFFCQYTSSHPVLVEVATLSEACKPDSLYINSKPCTVQCLAILSPIIPPPVIGCTKPHFFCTHW